MKSTQGRRGQGTPVRAPSKHCREGETVPRTHVPKPWRSADGPQVPGLDSTPTAFVFGCYPTVWQMRPSCLHVWGVPLPGWCVSPRIIIPRGAQTPPSALGSTCCELLKSGTREKDWHFWAGMTDGGALVGSVAPAPAGDPGGRLPSFPQGWRAV